MFLHDDVLYIAEHVIEPMTDQHHGLKDVIERTHQTFTMTATQIIAPNGFSAVNWFHGVDDGKAQKESFEKARKQMKFAMSYLNHVIEYGYGLTFEEVCEPSPGQTICMVVWCCDKEQYLPTVVYNNGNQIVVLDMHGNEMEDHSFTEHYGFSLTHTMIGSKWNRRK